MKKIIIEFQDENSTEFKVDAAGVSYRELLVLARILPDWPYDEVSNDKPTIKISFGSGDNFSVYTTGPINKWRLQLVADEFYLAAMHQFFAIQNRAMAQAAVEAAREEQANEIAIAKLQHGGRGNSGLILPRGQG